MPYFYNVEKKIGANIVILTLIGIISFSVCIYLFISNYNDLKNIDYKIDLETKLDDLVETIYKTILFLMGSKIKNKEIKKK